MLVLFGCVPVTDPQKAELLASKFGHISGLDGIRACAVLIVILSHVGLSHIIPGQFGVTVFFFLSGYLITTLLRKEMTQDQTISLKGFYFRRVIRIVPPMLIAIALVLILAQFGQTLSNIVYENLIWDFLFLTNYAMYFDQHSGLLYPLWSLGVEEHFYMIFPAFYLILARRLSNPQIALVCVSLCVFVLAIRLISYQLMDDIRYIQVMSHTRIDSILFGCCLALWNNPVMDKKRDVFAGKMVLVGAILILLSTFLIRDEHFRETYRYSLQGIGLFIGFNFAIRDRGWIAMILNSLPMRWIALFSYTLYLVHLPLLVLVYKNVTGIPVVMQTLLGILLALAFSAIIYVWVEKPLARWKSKKRSL